MDPQPLSPPLFVGSKAEPKSRSPLVFAGLACGGCLLVVIVGVALVVGFVMLGLGIISEQVEAVLQENPVVLEHLGEIEDLEIDLVETLIAPGENDFVFDARGTKGDGVLIVTSITVDGDREDIVAGTLQLASGEEIDLLPERGGKFEALP